MLIYKIKKTLINFVNSPGWTLHYFLMKFVQASGLNRFQRLSSLLSRLAQLMDRGLYQKRIMPKILHFLAKNHKGFIFFDHFLKRYLFIKKAPFPLSSISFYKKAIQSLITLLQSSFPYQTLSRSIQGKKNYKFLGRFITNVITIALIAILPLEIEQVNFLSMLRTFEKNFVH